MPAKLIDTDTWVRRLARFALPEKIARAMAFCVSLACLVFSAFVIAACFYQLIVYGFPHNIPTWR